MLHGSERRRKGLRIKNEPVIALRVKGNSLFRLAVLPWEEVYMESSLLSPVSYIIKVLYVRTNLSTNHFALCPSNCY